MWIYFFFLTIILLAEFLKIRSKFIFYTIIIITGLFLCFGYMTGSDWRYYELMYENLKYDISYDGQYEIGYYYYMVPFVLIGINFWHFFIFTKVILYGLSVYFLKKFSRDNFYFAFAIFFCLYGIFEFIDNPMRNLIAGTLFLFAFKLILEKKFIKYLLLCFISILFHKALILMIPLYFILNRSYKTKNIVILFIAFNITLFVFSEQLILIFKAIDLLSSSNSVKLNEQISGYILSDNIRDNPFSMGLISRYIIFIILILFKDKIEMKSIYGSIAFNSSIITLYILRLALVWPIVGRLSIPFSIFYCVSLATIIGCSIGFSRFKYYSIFTAIYCGVLYMQVTTVYKYIPYTSYLTYLGSDKPSYNYRSNYNLTKSPYRNTSPR